MPLQRSNNNEQDGYRSSTLFIAKSPETRSGTPVPLQVIVTYGTKRKAYSRERLMQLSYNQVVQILDEDFDVPRRSSAEEALCVTFYCRKKNSKTYDTSLIMIDSRSWKELMQDVIKIKLNLPKPQNFARKIWGAIVWTWTALCVLNRRRKAAIQACIY